LTAYGDAALSGECDKVLRAVEGGRSATLNSAAFSLGQLVAGGELGEKTTAQALIAAAKAIDMPTSEAYRIVRSGMRAGARRPRRNPGRPAKAWVESADDLLANAHRVHSFTGQAGNTDLRTYVALLLVAGHANSPVFSASFRQIAELAHIGSARKSADTKTVRRSLRRLVTAGLLRQEQQGKGTLASVWRLASNEERVRDDPINTYYRRTFSGVIFHPGSWNNVIWERGALGPSACRVWHSLASEGPQSQADLARATGLDRHTIASALHALDEWSLATCDGRVWSCLPFDAFDVADALGVYGKDVLRRCWFAQQREAYRAVQEHRPPPQPVGEVRLDVASGNIVAVETGEVVRIAPERVAPAA